MAKSESTRVKKSAGIPEFQSLKEEREYWEARGPLAEGHKGRLNKPKPGKLRSSFLTVRLTGEELTCLRDAAAAVGMGPSTYARLFLLSTIGGTRAVLSYEPSDKGKGARVFVGEKHGSYTPDTKQPMDAMKPFLLLRLEDVNELAKLTASCLLQELSGKKRKPPKDTKF